MATFDVYNLDKQKVSTLDLSDAVFAAEVNDSLLYEAVKMQQINRRSGTVAVKNRGLVSGGGKKPWKQKGTGRARQGSIRASHWVGGGKAMGPKPRDYSYRPPLKVRKGALRCAISLRAKEKQLWILDGFELGEGAARRSVSATGPTHGHGLTQRAAAAFAKLGFESALVVDLKANGKLHLSIRNLVGYDVLPPEGLNVEDVLRRPVLVLTAAAAKQVDERLA